FHVVSAPGTDSAAVLDGFTVRHGLANVAPHDNGAGLYVVQGSPTVRNTAFRWNRAGGGGAGQRGGGIYTEDGSPLVEDCVFEDNVAVGGGLFAWGGSPVIRRSVFRRNYA